MTEHQPHTHCHLTTPPEASQAWGLGERHASFKVYIGNQPAWLTSGPEDGVRPIADGDIHAIGQACGNGWRKVFNVYAKLLFAISRQQFNFQQSHPNWQAYRDNELLQAGSDTSLLFSPLDINEPAKVHLVMGKGHAANQRIYPALEWLTSKFAINRQHRVVVCPYFDYRQLSNQQIVYLVELLQPMLGE